MKATKLTSAVLLAPLVVLLTGCPKPKPELPPQADVEMQSSVDASYALFTITDAEMVQAFCADNVLSPPFYMHTPTSVGTCSTVGTIDADIVNFAFNANSNASDCKDGTRRDGTI